MWRAFDESCQSCSGISHKLIVNFFLTVNDTTYLYVRLIGAVSHTCDGHGPEDQVPDVQHRASISLCEQNDIYISSTITSSTKKVQLARASKNKDPERKIVQQTPN